MSCNCNTGQCETCPPGGVICVPQGDDVLVVFSVREDGCDGDLFDISGASEIVFIVADSFGGTVRIDKRLSDGEVFISTNGYQFYLTITKTESAALTRVSNYYECQVTSSGGMSRTVSAGLLKAPDTMIKDIP